MVVLVTGAAGFIGSNVVNELCRLENQVIGIDNLNNYYDPRLKHYRLSQLEQWKNFRFIEGSVENGPFMAELFESGKLDCVVNLAAMAGVRYSKLHPRLYFETNVLGTLNLLDLMVKNSVGRFVLASTSSLYAGHPAPFREEQPVNSPISPYAASKKSAEVLTYTYHHLYNISSMVLRFFTVYGPAGRPDMSYFRFIRAIDSGEPLTIFGDGQQSRDFTYVDDIVDGVIAAVHATANLSFEVINIGGGQNPISILSVVSQLEEMLGRKAILDFKPFEKADMPLTRADNSKASSLLNWHPKISLPEGLGECISWYGNNKSLVRSLAI